MPDPREPLGRVEKDTATAATLITGALLAELGRRLYEYENTISWETDCTRCAAVLDSSYAETVRREQAEATLAEVWQAMETFITIRGEYAQAGDLVEGLRQIRDRRPLDRDKSSSDEKGSDQ